MWTGRTCSTQCPKLTNIKLISSIWHRKRVLCQWITLETLHLCLCDCFLNWTLYPGFCSNWSNVQHAMPQTDEYRAHKLNLTPETSSTPSNYSRNTASLFFWLFLNWTLYPGFGSPRPCNYAVTVTVWSVIEPEVVPRCSHPESTPPLSSIHNHTVTVPWWVCGRLRYWGSVDTVSNVLFCAYGVSLKPTKNDWYWCHMWTLL